MCEDGRTQQTLLSRAFEIGKLTTAIKAAPCKDVKEPPRQRIAVFSAMSEEPWGVNARSHPWSDVVGFQANLESRLPVLTLLSARAVASFTHLQSAIVGAFHFEHTYFEAEYDEATPCCERADQLLNINGFAQEIAAAGRIVNDMTSIETFPVCMTARFFNDMLELIPEDYIQLDAESLFEAADGLIFVPKGELKAMFAMYATT